VWIIVEDQKNQITRYLLGQLDEADEEKVELRLLSDVGFTAEFDIVVDEIAIRYASGGFEGKEKEQVEHYFLRAPERQNKAKVMCELLHQSGTTRGEQQVKNETPPSVADDPGLWAKARRFWNTQPLVPRLAMILPMLLIVAGVVFWVRMGPPTTTNFATLTLTSTEAERGQGAADEIASTKLAPDTDELRIKLMLPALQTQPKSYRAELIVEGVSRDAAVISHDAQSVTVTVSAADLKPDRYAIRLFAENPDGKEERIPGSYIFRIEPR
jgi:hypothetical protein